MVISVDSRTITTTEPPTCSFTASTITKHDVKSWSTKNEKNHRTSFCNVCGGLCTARCSLCHLVYYCSVDCQRRDWKTHKKDCRGKNKNCKHGRRNNNTQARWRRLQQHGPSLPPPKVVTSEKDAQRALQELWSLANSDMAEKISETIESTTKIKNSSAKSVELKGNPESLARKLYENKQATIASIQKFQTKIPHASFKDKKTIAPSGNIYKQRVPSSLLELFYNKNTRNIENSTTSFVVEEMPQISRFQLTLKLSKSAISNVITTMETTASSMISVQAEPLGRARSRTRVTISISNNGPQQLPVVPLFVGDFPRPIATSDISWNLLPSSPSSFKAQQKGDDTTLSSTVLLLVRLKYHYDPTNTRSLVALGGGSGESLPLSSSSSTLDEINNILCGYCRLPLIYIPPSSTVSSATGITRCDDDESKSHPIKKKRPNIIDKVIPLPKGHWDEIADYLVCYDGQPVVDFAVGSQCARPGLALQDESLLCLHVKDVKMSVCALAVDGYGELPEEEEATTNTKNNNYNTTTMSSAFDNPFDLSEGICRLATTQTTTIEKKKDDATKNTTITSANGSSTINNEPPLSANSAVIRGIRNWRDTTDGGESVCLCCGRCCAILGFTSLASPETWRFWKHRLTVPNINDQQDANQYSSCITSTIPPTRPLSSCSSFLARELVRYAESKAIFTFVVRCEAGNDSEKRKQANNTNASDRCLLLRLLSWETALSTSFKETGIGSSSLSSTELVFEKVAKIIFEEAIDPTVTTAKPKFNHRGKSNEKARATAQWFWGGVDLCCPLPHISANTIRKSNPDDPDQQGVSTARLQLPSDEYERVVEDLKRGTDLFESGTAEATILLKMGGIWKGLGLTAVPLG